MQMQMRWSAILSILEKENEISSTELAERLNASQATIRRDLSQMEEMNLIARYHGGAKAVNHEVESPVLMRSELHADIKERIGRYAAGLIHDGQMIYIDAGSSTLAMIPYITAKNITVATIGIPQIVELMQRRINLIVIGGSVRPSTSAISGFKTLEQLQSYYFDIAFVGTNAVHRKVGLSTTNDMEAACKSKVIERAGKTYILSDQSKFNKICPVPFASLNQVKIITDGIGSDNYDMSDIIIVK